MKKKHTLSQRAQLILLAVSFCIGVPTTYWLTDGELRKIHWLYALIVLIAVISDAAFVRLLLSLLHRKKVFSKAIGAIGRVLKAVGRRVSRVAEKTFGSLFSKNKTFIGGKRERAFVIESHEKQEKTRRRKMPRLPKNATEREKIRYEYVSYVFGKDRDIPSSLTPNEVGARLDPKGEDAELFKLYNGARYAE